MSNDQQRTPEWFKEREGKLTASSFGQAAGLAPGSRQQLWRRQMGLETFDGNEATQWGEDNEPIALEAYRSRCLDASKNIKLVGFISHPTMAWLGGSPDLLIGKDGMGEIKCPFSKQIYPSIPPYYMAQMQGLLQITDRKWCDFIVWTPDAMQVNRVYRSDEYWDWLHIRLADFWVWVCAQVEPPREKKQPTPEFDLKVELVLDVALKGN